MMLAIQAVGGARRVRSRPSQNWYGFRSRAERSEIMFGAGVLLLHLKNRRAAHVHLLNLHVGPQHHEVGTQPLSQPPPV